MNNYCERAVRPFTNLRKNFGMTTSGRTDYELIVQELLCYLNKKYNQAENPYIPETPVNTGALVYCYRDWMLTTYFQK